MKSEFDSAGGARLQNIIARLSAVPAGAEIAAMLRRHDVKITFDSARSGAATSNFIIGSISGTDFVYSGFEIILNQDLGDDNLIQALVHESQHVRHHANGLGNPGFIAGPEEDCLIRRVQEADAQAKATEICWQMKQAGDPGPFAAAAAAGYGDVCTAFERACAAAPEAAFDGSARRAAFAAWFGKDSRLAYYDRDTLTAQAEVLQGALNKNPGHLLKPAAAGDEIAWLRGIGALSEPDSLAGLDLAAPLFRRNIAQNVAASAVSRAAAPKKQAARPGTPPAT